MSTELKLASDAYQSGNLKEAARHYKAAAEEGCIDAAFFVGWLLYSGKCGEKDIGTARKYFENALVGGHSEAAFYLGRSHEEDAEFDKALHYYKIGAKLNDSPSMYRAGKIIWRNKGDVRSALPYLRAASNRGHVFGRSNYAKALMRIPSISERASGAFLFLKSLALGRVDELTQVAD